MKRLCPPPQKRKRQQRDEQLTIGTIYRHVKKLTRERKAAVAGVPVAPEELVAAAGVAALAGAAVQYGSLNKVFVRYAAAIYSTGYSLGVCREGDIHFSHICVTVANKVCQHHCVVERGALKSRTKERTQQHSKKKKKKRRRREWVFWPPLIYIGFRLTL